jgi:hypothetical protein
MLRSLLQRWTGVEPNPITSNSGQRIAHAVKREGIMILHELSIVMNMFTALWEDERTHSGLESLVLEI